MRLAGRIGAAIIALLALLAAAELALRASGYGAPVLYVADDDYEYALAPNQSRHRWAVRITTNRFGMRSADFDPGDETPQRVMVLGDSIVAAGNWTDQDKLATNLLAQDGRFVMNVAAGSWGPGNQLEFVRRHGLFGAQDVIIVWSNEDLSDDRTFAPLNRYDTPTRAPLLALARFVDQYLFNGVRRARAESARASVENDAYDSAIALLRRLSSAGVRVCVVEHVPLWSRDASEPDELSELASAHGVRLISIEPYYRAAMQAGEELARDHLHPNDAGQAALAEAFRDCLAERDVVGD